MVVGKGREGRRLEAGMEYSREGFQGALIKGSSFFNLVTKLLKISILGDVRGDVMEGERYEYGSE